jgi:N-acetylglucosaminyldiphosphoundecaprenol N-acetyl-beta-D-mannosaminyltransferase
MSSAVSQILDAARRAQKGIVVTPNVDHIVMLQDDADMRRIYKGALFRYADGMPIVWLSKLVKRNPLPERVAGSDLLIALCEKSAGTGLALYFMGGNPGVADKAADKLRKHYDGLNIVGTWCPPMGFEHDPDESERIITDINSRNVAILFIGVGAPKQEKWADAHIDRLKVGPILCVGASFDFAAGTTKRAPKWIQKIGFEWVWRLASDPGRLWKRYLVQDSRFLPLALKEIFKA